MKHFLLAILFLGLINVGQAQITVTSATFPVAGDSLITATDNLPAGIDMMTGGGNQTWDFSNLQAPFSQSTVFRPASEGQDVASFPNANALTAFGPGEAYYDSNASTFEFLGYTGTDPAGLGIDLIAKFSPPVVERRSPMNFNDFNESSSNVVLPFAWEDLPPAITDSLDVPIQPDSIRLSITNERTDEVDAWGTATIPGGQSYEVLRLRRWEISNTSLEALVPLFGWQDISDLVGNFFGADTTLTYNFYSNIAKEEIAIVTADPMTEEVTRVEYKTDEVFTTNIKNLSATKADLYAYPNPAIEDVRFEFANLKNGQYNLKLYNILGIPVWEDTFYVAGSRTIEVDLSNFKKGTYLYSLSDMNGKTITTKRLMVLKP